MREACDIIIPVWNQLDVTKDCVASIVKNTDLPFRLIVIDNGSDRETAEYLRARAGEKLPNVRLVRNETNLGFVKAVNQGLEAADAAYVCVMNNDTLATAGWLDEMLEVMKSDPRLGIVNPSSNTSGQIPPEEMGIDEYAASLKKYAGRTQELNTCRGFCMLIRTEVIRRIGLLDERYSIGYFEETDFCKRAQRAGFMLGRAKAAYVYHEEGTSFKALGDRQSIFRENERIYFKRWGRLVRAAYLVDGIPQKDKIDEIATAAARGGHQMLVFIKRGAQYPVKTDHFDIRKLEVDPVFFGAGSVAQLFKRRKKKPVEVVLTDNGVLGGFLKATKLLHGADVIVRPEKEEVLRCLGEKSRQPK